jgi:DNA-binding LacI/PurR family transcriptional regulator
MAITIQDVAIAAGVSVGTVSRALKNQRGLRRDAAPCARQMVWQSTQS